MRSTHILWLALSRFRNGFLSSRCLFYRWLDSPFSLISRRTSFSRGQGVDNITAWKWWLFSRFDRRWWCSPFLASWGTFWDGTESGGFGLRLGSWAQTIRERGCCSLLGDIFTYLATRLGCGAWPKFLFGLVGFRGTSTRGSSRGFRRDGDSLACLLFLSRRSCRRPDAFLKFCLSQRQALFLTR